MFKWIYPLTQHYYSISRNVPKETVGHVGKAQHTQYALEGLLNMYKDVTHREIPKGKQQ